MKQYSIPRQIFRAIIMPIIFLAVQVVVIVVGQNVFGFQYGMDLAAQGITQIDPEAYTAAVLEFTANNAILFTLISGVISLVIFGLVFKKESKFLPKFEKNYTPARLALIAVLGVAIYIVLVGIMTFTNIMQYFPSYESVNQALTSGSVILRLVTVGIVGPLVEELCVRGLVYNRLKSGKMPVIAAMIISSAIFGIIHLNLLQGLYAFVLGMIIVAVYEKFKTLWAPIIFHVAFNVFSTLLTMVDDISDPVFIAMFAVSVVVTGACGYVLLKKTKNADEIPSAEYVQVNA